MLRDTPGEGDAALVEAARHGDRRAFELLLVPLIQPAFRIARAMLGDRDEADDAVQEAALRAWQAAGHIRPGTPALRPWFLTIVVNQCRQIRRRRWWRVVRLPAIDGMTAYPADIEGSWDLKRILAGLPERDRLLLYLHFGLDMPFPEVGAVIGISPGAAKSRLYRITRRLRPALAGAEEVRSHGA
jgi:RNA polymerase sigma-70 factor (ECF subfamily)